MKVLFGVFHFTYQLINNGVGYDSDVLCSSWYQTGDKARSNPNKSIIKISPSSAVSSVL